MLKASWYLVIRGPVRIVSGDILSTSNVPWYLILSITIWWLSGKEYVCNARDPGLIPGLGRSPGDGNGHPLQYSCLENSMDRGAWQATVHGVPNSQTLLL